jgi:hypothetical protein
MAQLLVSCHGHLFMQAANSHSSAMKRQTSFDQLLIPRCIDAFGKLSKCLIVARVSARL